MLSAFGLVSYLRLEKTILQHYSASNVCHGACSSFQDGEIDPADVHVDGVPTIEEERQMEEDKRYRCGCSKFVAASRGTAVVQKMV